MSAQITTDAIGQAWIVAMLATCIIGIFWKPTWAVFFGVGTVALAYAGNWLMFPYAFLFAIECVSCWTGKPPLKVVHDVVTGVVPAPAPARKRVF